jgi:hypothetical protein
MHIIHVPMQYHLEHLFIQTQTYEKDNLVAASRSPSHSNFSGFWTPWAVTISPFLPWAVSFWSCPSQHGSSEASNRSWFSNIYPLVVYLFAMVNHHFQKVFDNWIKMEQESNTTSCHAQQAESTERQATRLPQALERACCSPSTGPVTWNPKISKRPLRVIHVIILIYYMLIMTI